MDTLFIGREIHKFQEISSTNVYLKDLCRNTTVNEGFTVLTEKQTSGRGQFGNTWEAEGGKNLLFSILLKPKFLKPEKQFLLNMSVCLALVDSLNELVPGFTIKWPNDILFDRKKIAGILIENSLVANALENSVIGMGINVNQQDFGKHQNRTSIINILKHPVKIQLLFEKILKKTEIRYLRLRDGNIKYLFNDYYQLLYGYHKEVPVKVFGNKEMLKIKGIEAGGRLIAQIKSEQHLFNFKEIEFLY